MTIACAASAAAACARRILGVLAAILALQIARPRAERLPILVVRGAAGQGAA